MKKYLVLILSIMMLLNITACSDSKQNNENTEFADDYREYGADMLVLGLVNDTEPTENGVVYLESLTDNLNVQFSNLTDTDSEYILKVFLDYKEMDFLLDGKVVSDYIFQAKAGEALVIPIVLKDDMGFETSHILTVAVLTAPNKHAAEIDLMSNSYGMVLSYELAKRDAERQVNALSKAEEPQGYLEMGFQGLMLNQDLKFVDGAPAKFPEKELLTEPGETVSLAYRAGNYENTDDILFVVLVDWEQQNVNDSPYTHIINKEGYVSYGEISFQAPTEPGKYEVVAFIESAPYALRDFETFHTHDTAYRFTLVVE